MNAQRHVGALHDVGRENVAVVEAACGQRRIEHPRSGANADGFVAGLLSNPHGQVLWRCYRRVLRRPAQEAINIPPQPRIQNWFKHALRIPRRRQLHRWRHHELSSRRRCSADEESCGPTARAPQEMGSSAAGKREPSSTLTMHNKPPRRITARPPRDHRTSFDACALANSARQYLPPRLDQPSPRTKTHFEAAPTPNPNDVV